MPATSFRDLKVWQKAHAAVKAPCRLSQDFPPQERFGLTAQARAAAVSIPANICEGFGRRSRREKARFYNIAEGSLEELRYYLILAVDLGFVCDARSLEQCLDEVARMLRALIRSVLAYPEDPV